MFDYIDTIVGATATVVGVALGVLNEKRRQRNKPRKDPSVCSCSHGYGRHDNTGKCHAQILDRYEDENYVEQIRTFDCTCLRYDGVPPGHLYLNGGM